MIGTGIFNLLKNIGLMTIFVEGYICKIWKICIYIRKDQKLSFFSPPQAQEMLISVHLSCLNLSEVLNLHSFDFMLHDDFRMTSGQLHLFSQVSLRSLCAYFVRQVEPKILCLVFHLFYCLKY